MQIYSRSSNKDKQDLIRAAAVHDWDKKLSIKGVTLDLVEQANITRFMSEVNPRKKLLTATSPEFVDVYRDGNPSLLEKMMFYIDNITNEGAIEPFQQRIESARVRNPDHNWDTELAMSSAIEKELAELAIKNKSKLSSPDQLPTLILSIIKGRMDDFVSSEQVIQ